jgi:hypothetical protein
LRIVFPDGVIHYIINPATKGVHIHDRRAFVLRQKEKRVKEIRLDGLREVALERARPIPQMPGSKMNLIRRRCFHNRWLEPSSARFLLNAG